MAWNMLVEFAKPISLIFCILSLYGVFHSAFLVPGRDIDERICGSLYLLALAATISLIGGLIFRNAADEASAGAKRVIATLPVRLFYWSSGAMLVLFIVSWYLESHCIFYRDVRF
ncbi:MAG: hypothetical protein WCA99_00325 [Candidatus Sulfotelmatobacter sp.]